MPVHRMPELRLPLPDDRARLDRMPGSKVPVIRQPFGAGDRLPFWAMGGFRGNHLYDLRRGSRRRRANLRGHGAPRSAPRSCCAAALVEVEAPDDQLARLGLA